MLSWPLVGYVLKAALRDRLLLSLLLVAAVGASLAVFLGSSAVIESDQFAIVFAAGGLRLAGVGGLVLFVVFHIRRAFESRDVDFLLSRPISRTSFLLSHAFSFSVLSFVAAFFVAFAVFALAPHMISAGYWLWAFSLVVEFIIIVNAALFFSMVLSSAVTSALAVFAFYVLARLIGQILGIIDSGMLTTSGFDLLEVVMQLVSLVIPRLDMMSQTSWLVYGPGQDVGFLFVLLQGMAYAPLLILAALVDLVRRQF